MFRNISLLLFICYFHVASGDDSEPTCFSRFDYDEKMLMKLLKIEEKIQKFQGSIDDIIANYDMEKVERRKLFDSEIDSLREQNAEEVEKQNNLTAEIQEAVSDAKTQLGAHLQSQKSSQKGDLIAFTVTGPSDASSNSLTFTGVVTSKGGGYDTTTGIFTCPVSGLYYFSLHLVKKRDSGVDTAGCYLSENGENRVRAYIDPQDGATGADAGSYGVSNSAYLELEAGDVIAVKGCSSGAASAVESWSSLSGVLVKRKI